MKVLKSGLQTGWQATLGFMFLFLISSSDLFAVVDPTMNQEIIKTKCIDIVTGERTGTANNCAPGNSFCIDTTCATN